MLRSRQQDVTQSLSRIPLCLLLLLLTYPNVGEAKTIVVEAEDSTLQRVVDSATPADTLLLKSGIHKGPIVIHKSIKLVSDENAVIDGGGAGRLITIDAEGVEIRGLTIQNSGKRLDIEDSGIFVTPKGHNAYVRNNVLRNNLIGVYLKGPNSARISRNRIVGNKNLRLNERGNGVQLWRTPGSIVEDNEISWGRDGIFVTTSKNNKFRNNRIHKVRFAVHYMYTNNSEVKGNISRSNHLGFAIMYARNIKVLKNRSIGDRDHGILLNYANSSVIQGNHVSGGTNKCVFIYNANKNRLVKNRFEDCGIGIHFTAGSERNVITENLFRKNRIQVKYVGTRFIEWSENGRGNYWSDNPAFDLNADGIGDRPYKPNSFMDQLIWRHPTAKLLMTSPAFHLLTWTQSIFPALFPGGVTDSASLMSPPIKDSQAEGTGG